MKRKKRRLIPKLVPVFLLLLLYSNYKLVVRTYTVKLKGLPQEFEQYKIAQISDLHGREILTAQLLRALNRRQPDIIAITGDFIDEENQLEPLVPFLKALCAIAPCYYVTGNHEWAGIHTEEFLKRLRETGVVPLRNGFTELIRNGASVTLAGVEDKHGYADMITPSMLAEKMPAGVSILLCHRPDEFKSLANDGYSLVLSGHVHGGLIRLPYFGGLFGPGRVFLPEYTSGLYREGESQMIVSRGLAASKLLPRLFNAPELTMVRLSAE